MLYSINSGTTQPSGSFNNLAQGSYTVQVTDANGCSTSEVESVSNIPGPVINTLPVTNSTCNAADDGSVSITLNGGTGPFQYSLNGGPQQLSGFFGNLSPGTYSISVSDANGCDADSTATTSEPSAVTVAYVTGNTTCGLTNGSLSVSGNGGTGILEYSVNGGLSYQGNGTFGNLAAGNYTIQVQDGNGCTAASNATLTDAPGPAIQSATPADISCNGYDDGTITMTTIGGTAPLQYSIDNGTTFQPGNQFTSLGPGVFTVLVTDANGCSVTATATITEPSGIITSVSATSTLCNGSNDGTATVTAMGGNAPYNYAWSGSATGQATAGNLLAGTYTVTVTDANGCTVEDITTVSEPAPISVTDSVENISCFGSIDGYILLTAAGGTAPFAYQWSSAALSGHENDQVAAGNYTVTVTDANGCTSIQQYQLTEPAAISLSIAATDVSCFGFSDGSATVTASGGTTPFTFLWSDNSTSAAAATLVAGTYTVTVTDDNGCTSEISQVVNTPDELTTVLVSGAVTCNGGADGTAAVTVDGGTQPYVYLWNNGDASAAISGIMGGIYSVSITDANNCLTTASVAVVEPAPISVTLNGATTLCIGQSAVISAVATGGNGGFTYSWSNGTSGSSQTVSPAITSTYNVTVTDSLGCPGTGTALIVTVNAALALTLSPADTVCEGTSLSLSAIASGGDGGPYTYTWTGLTQTTGQVQVMPAVTTTYVVSVSDGCGTPAVNATVEIVVHPNPVVNFTPQPAEGCVPLLVSFDNTTTTPPGTTYEWYFGDNSSSAITEPDHLYTEAGFYTVTLKALSAEGCSGLLIVPDAVKVYPVPEAAVAAEPPVASILNPVIQFSDMGYGSTWWNWDFGDNTAYSSEPNPSHTYSDSGKYAITLYVMNDHGCRDTAYYEIVIEGIATVFIPNAFSPNFDGRNDEFLVAGIGLNDIEMSIFNRWGNKVFTSGSLSTGWDGMDHYSGTECPQGVYVYLVRVRNFKGEFTEYTGRVTLVR